MARKRKVQRVLITILVCAAAAYAGLCLLVWLVGDVLLFPAPTSSYADDGRIIKLTTRDGAKISAFHQPAADATYTILFSHGNGEDIGRNRRWMDELAARGYSVFAYDYHGYGTSEGRASEQAVYADIDAAYDHLTGTLGVPPERIILYGRSIGSGPSVDLATRRPVAGLVLECPFASAFRAATRITLLPLDKFRNLAKMPSVPCPVLVIHGRRDMIVPFSQGQALFAAARGPKRSLWIDPAGHNTCIQEAGEEYFWALKEFVEMVAECENPADAGSLSCRQW